MAQPPPDEKNDKGEVETSAVPANNLSPMQKFRSVTKRLLHVPRDEIDERERPGGQRED